MNIFDVLERRQQLLRDDFKKLPDAAMDDEQLSEKLAIDYGLAVPTLDEANKYATTREVDIDVSQDPMRYISDRSRPFFVRGTEITIHVPFQGDPALFKVRPSQFNMNPPRGEFDEHELRFVFKMIEPKDINPEIERTLTSVRQHLDWQRPSADQLKTQLRQLAQSLITQRNQRRVAHEEAVAKLGIPIRRIEEQRAEPAMAVARPVGKSGRKKQKRATQWDFFISHASEDKEEIARPLADALINKGFKVWYDDFALKVGDTLLESIDRGLAGSQFGIVILSPHFFAKHWPKQELSGLAIRESDGRKVILPVWHKVGVEEVRRNSPTLAGRLGVSTEKDLDHVVQKLLDATDLTPGSR